RDQDAQVPAAAVERIADHAAVRRMRFHGAALAIRDDDVADDLAGKRDPQDCSPGGPRGSGDGDAVAKFPGVTRPVTRVRVRQRRLRLVVAAAVQRAGGLVHAPRHELGAVPGPVPVRVVLGNDGTEYIRLAHVGRGEVEDLLAGGHRSLLPLAIPLYRLYIRFCAAPAT